MPTIKGVPGPYRLYFYSFDCNEPVHVHADRERMECKFWLAPVVLASNDGFHAAGTEPHPVHYIGARSTNQKGMG